MAAPIEGQVVHPSATNSRWGAEDHLVYHEDAYEAEPYKHLRDLARPPVIRQWFQGSKLYREPGTREIPRIELFFDLLFVAVVHQLAEAAVEEPGGAAVARFVLTFWPSWSVWEEAGKYSNLSGRDDVLHRVWILIGMICILGYSVNASAIELTPAHGEEELDHSAIRAATAFYLIIKLTRVVSLWFHAWKLPKFRLSQISASIALFIPMFIYFPLIFVTNRHAQIVIAAVGMAVDVFRLDFVVYYIYGKFWQRRLPIHERTKEFYRMPVLPKDLRLPAMNIEHSIDRSGAFVVIVLGELVMNLLYIATRGEIGASLKFGRAVLGLMIAWALNYLYMLPMEPNNQSEHPLRRSMLSGIIYNFLHWPLCAALVLASAACGKLMQENHVEIDLEWYWGAGIGFALLSMTLLDMCYYSRCSTWDFRVPRFIRHTVGIAGALALIFMPFGAEDLSSTALLGVAVAVTWFVLLVHIVGMLPTRKVIRRWEEAERRREEEGDVARRGLGSTPSHEFEQEQAPVATLA